MCLIPVLPILAVLPWGNYFFSLDFSFFFLIFFWVGQGFKLRASSFQNSIKTQLQSIVLWLFWRWGLENYLPWLVLNCNPPNLSLSSGQDYRCEPPAPGLDFSFYRSKKKIIWDYTIGLWSLYEVYSCKVFRTLIGI
jgi:hypothetical protein